MKTALVLHGWPQSFATEHPLNNLLTSFGYGILTPDLFSDDNLLDSKNLQNWIARKLGKKKLDLIVGISMGGLILPQVAKNYTEAKLIFIASGTKFDPKVKRLKSAIEFCQTKFGMKLAGLLINIPQVLFEFLYKIFDPFSGDESEHRGYIDDMRQNLIAIKKIPIAKHAEIAKVVTDTNNQELLKKLRNRTLILSGKKDLC